MAWCHSCSAEFQEGIEICPTCDIPLDALPPEEPEEIDDDALIESGEELTVLGRADFPTVLELRRLLHKATIPCAILREEVDPETATPQELHHPRFELLVQTSRLEDAAGAIDARSREMLAKEGLAPLAAEDTSHCPACGAALSETAADCPDCGLTLGS